MGNPLFGFKDWSFGRLAALASKVGDPETCEAVLRGERLVTVSPADKKLAKNPANILVTGSWLADWEYFYSEVFGITRLFSEKNKEPRIPNKQPGFDWVLIITESLTLSEVWQKCQAKFESAAGFNLETVVPDNTVIVMKPYAKRLRNRVEADEELKDLSANMLEGKNFQSITLLERLLLELWYFWKTGDHLDKENYTLCAGSRCKAGDVPIIKWSGNMLGIERCDPSYSSKSIRSRKVI